MSDLPTTGDTPRLSRRREVLGRLCLAGAVAAPVVLLAPDAAEAAPADTAQAQTWTATQTFAPPSSPPSSAVVIQGDLIATSGTYSFTPGQGDLFEVVSSVVLTQTNVGSPPPYQIPASSAGLAVDEFGNVRMGPNETIPEHVWAWDNNNYTTNAYPLFDAAYHAATRRFYSRHFFGTEISNPSNLQLGRVNATDMNGNDQYPFPTASGAPVSMGGTPDPSQQRGVEKGQTLGKIVFRGAVAPYGSPAGGAGAAFNGDSATIFGSAAEDFIEDPQNHANSGGHMFFNTRPTASPGANADRVGVHSQGPVGILNLTYARSWFETLTWGLDPGALIVTNHMYGFGRVYASHDPNNGTNASEVMVGDAGPEGEAGVSIAQGDVRMYRSSAGGALVITGHTYGLGRLYARYNANGSDASQVMVGDVGPNNEPGVLLGPSGDVRMYRTTNGGVYFAQSGAGIQTVSGSRGSNAALQSLLAALASMGLVSDHTTAT
jgi:hypothetical protein